MSRVLRPTLVAAALFVVATGGPALADSLSENTLLSNARLASEQSSSELLLLESKALAAGARADRQGDRLVLRLRSGNTKAYANGPECKNPDDEAKCQKYSLIVDAHTRGLFVVAKVLHEGLDIILIDDHAGEETVLRHFPIFSPSGKNLLVLLENDPELGFAVQIWRRNGARFIQDWSGSPHSDGMYVSYKMLRWPSEDVIEVQSDISFEPPKPNILKRFTLRRRADGWKMTASP